MYNIKTLNKIAQVGLDELDKSKYAVSGECADPAGILVRSADMLEAELPESLLAIARAGAGTNNIPIDRCSEAGIVVFNTPGANANAVKELVLCALLLTSRDVLGGAAWVRDQAATPGVEVSTVVEKGKSAFAGPELYRKTLGVVGLGAIGALVANIGLNMGMDVYGYDPYLSVDAALRLDRHVHVVKDIDLLYQNCDYITLHVPAVDATKGMIDAAAIAKMKDGVRIVNLARGTLVKDDDLIAALESGKVAAYATDFPNNKLVAAPHVAALPHLGASTPESEDNCAVMAARELRDYLENGNIVNSVNLPQCTMPWTGTARLCIHHRNSPGILAGVTSALSAEGINVENMTNKSKGDYAYTMVELNSVPAPAVVDHLRGVEGVQRVRVLER